MVKGIVLDTKVLDRIAKELKPDVQKRIGQSAFRVKAKAQMDAPIDLSAHINSAYVIAPGQDTSSRAKSAASAIRPKARIDTPVKPKNDMTAIIGFLMEYSLFLEIGTSKMAARPHLVPAMESEEKPLIADLKKMIK